MRDFTRLEVWQRARAFARDVYSATVASPRAERFGLTSQLRESAISIGANIAEGSGRGSDTDYARFVRYAAGSANEAEHHLIVAYDLGYLAEADLERLRGNVRSIRSMLSRLGGALRTDTS